MKKILAIFVFLSAFTFSYTEVFQVKTEDFIRNIVFWGCLDLGNNYIKDIYREKLTKEDVLTLSSKDIPFFDRWISFKPDKKLKDLSDYSYIGLLGTGLAISSNSSNLKSNVMTLSQILLAQSAVGKWVKTITARKRPYVYDKSTIRKNQNSFYSLHTSGAFAIATFSYYHYMKSKGRNYYFAALFYGGALLTASLRVASAQHFPSDVAVGAAAGSLIAYLFCKHYENSSWQLSVNSNYLGLNFSF